MTLTREEILAMEPGQELSELVAVHVMDYEVGVVSLGHWEPSENISAAWEVESIFDQDTPLREDYAIELHNVMGLMLHEPTTLNNVYQFAHATPEQRCKAALLAVLNL
ncbi:BC1872 family protein [Paenibacillus sp. FSL L8-0708]|uniref:BC1872 family protein n=1 Tax=Paenibacillus sp. FSL L8-0708 TaxID=2975311 RepID=UPI0030F9746B